MFLSQTLMVLPYMLFAVAATERKPERPESDKRATADPEIRPDE